MSSSVVDEWAASGNGTLDKGTRARIVERSGQLVMELNFGIELHCPGQVIPAQWQTIEDEDAHYELLERVKQLRGALNDLHDFPTVTFSNGTVRGER